MRVALVHLGRAKSLGTARRVQVWRELLTLAGIDVIEVDLLRHHRLMVPSPVAVLSALRGRTVLEAATWSVPSSSRAIAAAAVDAVILSTPRAFHPHFATLSPITVLDFQDQFSRSYAYRAQIDHRRAVRRGYALLARMTRRFEQSQHSVHAVAAGWSDAHSLRATWVPLTVDAEAAPINDRADADWDFLFFGKLSYAPNVDAIRRLAALWPRIRSRSPEATLLLAGREPTDEVRMLVARHAWGLAEDFRDAAELCARARVALVPMRFSSGIQIKVLEAAAAGLPQVVTPSAIAGMRPGFPAEIADSDADFVDRAAALLKNPRHRVELATNAWRHVGSEYSADVWSGRFAQLLDRWGAGAPASRD